MPDLIEKLKDKNVVETLYEICDILADIRKIQYASSDHHAKTEMPEMFRRVREYAYKNK